MAGFGTELERLLRELEESGIIALNSGELDTFLATATATPLLLRQAQEALGRREHEFRELVEHAPYGIARVSRDLRYLYVNPAFESLLGVPPRDVVGATNEELGVPDEVAAVFEEACSVAIETGEQQNVDLDWPVGAAPLHFSARLTPEADAEGRVSSVLAVIRDVTDQRLAERGLRESELLFRSLTEQGADMIVVLDREAAVQYASPSVERQMGYEPRSLLGRSLLGIVHPDDREAIRQGLENRIRTPGVGTAMRFRARAQDGGWRVLEAVATNLFDDPGIQGVVVNARDITERAEAEEARRASEERLQRILETVTDAITIINADGKITYANAGAEKVLGLRREEITGRLFNSNEWQISAVDGGEFPEEELAFARVMRTGAPAYGMEHAIRHPDGRRVILSINAAPLRDAENRPAGVVAAIRDITEQRMAADALQQRERYFRSLIEGASDVITILDPEGTIIYESPSIEHVLGYAVEDLVGGHAFDLIHPDDRQRVWEEFARGVADPRRRTRVEYRFLHKDGTWRHMESTATNQLEDPAIGGIVVNSRDVSDRHHLESQLLQAQKLEAVGRLAGGIAHDFNNLLQVIGGNARLLALGEESPEDTVQELEEIENAVARAGALTQQLLAFSRRQLSRPEVLSVTDELVRMNGLLRRLLGEDIEVVSLLEADPAQVMMDRSQFDQIVLNLAINARDAMPAGGRLTLSLKLRDLSKAAVEKGAHGVAPGRYIVLSVNDTGSGMDPNIIPLIFEPFFTTKEPGQGTGLGLSTVYGIVRDAGGFVEVKSAPGEGTTFRVHLPAVAGASAERPTEWTDAGGRGELILVVDDDVKVRRVVCRMLERFDYRTIEAANGEEGIRTLEQRGNEISLVVTDVVMPLMGGRELARWIDQHMPEKAILFMSGYMDDGGDGLPVDAVDRAFISKPLRQDVLRSKVHRLLHPASRG